MAKVAGLSLSFLIKAALARLASPPNPGTAFPGEKTALTCCYLGKRGGEISTPAPTLGGLSYYACVTLPLCVPGKSNDRRRLTALHLRVLLSPPCRDWRELICLLSWLYPYSGSSHSLGCLAS